jgi:uncharacterized protein YndB with AHSA1/START domain
MRTPEKTSALPSVVQKKIIPAKRSDVFDAWTRPEIMEQWFFPGPWSAVSKTDLRVGGRWSNEMIDRDGGFHNGKEHAPGARYLHEGEYLEIKRPERLVFTWNSPFVTNTRVTIELRDHGNDTELTLTHELLPDEEQRKSHTDGWAGCLNNLEAHYA